MTKIINLTQHAATQDQIDAGVVDLTGRDLGIVKQALTFDYIPDSFILEDNSRIVTMIASDSGADAAMIGGAPYLMAPLEKELKNAGIKPVYAFSKRVSVEDTNDDGNVVKRNIFKHLGFVDGDIHF